MSLIQSLFIISTIYSAYGINIKQFTVGAYILEPYDYDYNSHLIIEMWGSGASGDNNFAGGAGGYLKLLIPSMETTWIINVGTHSANTTFASIYNEYFFSAGGGNNMYGGINYISNNKEIKEILNINGQSNECFNIDNKYEIIISCAGGASPYGGKGGNSEIYLTSGEILFNSTCGSFPAGGGGIKNIGGDGLMNIYY
jgi:hypothetical protein